MPNHVTTILRLPPEAAALLVRIPTAAEHDAYAEEEARMADWAKQQGRPFVPNPLPERFVDFDLLVPMPAAVKGTTVGSGGFDSYDERGWYGWSLRHWGTKWNAYESEVSGDNGDLAVVRFDTAWSHPVPIIEELSRRNPGVTIEVLYADEDMGSNCGAYSITDGEITEQIIEDGTDEAYELAAQVKYGRPYAELKAEWDAEEAEWEARYARATALAAENGIEVNAAMRLIVEEESQKAIGS